MSRPAVWSGSGLLGGGVSCAVGCGDWGRGRGGCVPLGVEPLEAVLDEVLVVEVVDVYAVGEDLAADFEGEGQEGGHVWVRLGKC